MAKARDGQGSIRKRVLKDGTVVWDASVSVRDPVTGVSSRPSKRGLPSEAAAVEWVQAQRASKTRHVQGLTVDDLAGLYWAAEPHKPTTLSAWRYLYRRFIAEYLGEVPLSELRPAHIDAWLAKVRPGKSAGYVSSIVSPLSAILKYGVANRYLDANWVDASVGVTKLRKEMKNYRPKKKKPWTISDFRNFLQAERSPQYRAMWCYIAATGVRRGAACGLLWDEVDFDSELISSNSSYVDTPDGRMNSTQKSGALLEIHMDVLLQGILLGQKTRQEESGIECPWVFDRPVLQKGQEPGRQMNPPSVTSHFARTAKRAGCPHGTPHNLRHLWVTLAREAGASRDAVGDVVGHSSNVVTMIYDHSETEKKALASSMAKLLLG